MSKQPCVWVVEARGGSWTNQWSAIAEVFLDFPSALEAMWDCSLANVDYREFRVVKYVRVEPKKKKGRK